jgi:hypothetical protein
MASQDVTTAGRGADGSGGLGRGVRDAAQRLTTETKSFFKTSEFWAYAITFIAILIAGNAIEAEEGGPDIFGADKVWLYITILTVGYMVSRGIAKSGVRDPFDAERGDRHADH